MVAHSLASYAKNLSDEMYWLEDSPPPAVEALYQDSLHINEWLIVLLSIYIYNIRDNPEMSWNSTLKPEIDWYWNISF